MRFKKLEIFGFKSFAEKTTIHFEPGVTAIVGPNGSGKSNIVDAIRWVLGEHNPRDIRAQKAADILFNGTDKRSPLSVAEVHLTISNEQGLIPISFSEITVSRRIFRSGETQYLINKSPCRLRDIRELFLGTGLGGGTYAIIAQGHIDMVLSSKPDERRIVFEEASGIARYLIKKRETMRRLDEVEEHLVRIEDIISEVRRQVKTLERQANKARLYQERWEKLKELELRLAVDELKRGDERSTELENRLQELRAQEEALEKLKELTVRSLEACNSDVSSAQQAVEQVKSLFVEHQNAIQQHRSQLGLKEGWIKELDAQIVQLREDEERLASRFAHFDGQESRITGVRSEIQTQKESVADKLAKETEELDRCEARLNDLQRRLEEKKKGLFEASAAAADKRKVLSQTLSELRGLESQLGRVEGRQLQQQNASADLKVRREMTANELEELETQFTDIHRRIDENESRLAQAEQRKQTAQEKLDKLRDQLSSGRTHVRLLEDLWQRYEGFPETVKVLMNSPVEGVVGPLVDCIQAVAGYEEVVEAALGPLAESIVVRDRQSLSQCSSFLRQRGLDGARFIVLDDCRNATEPQPAMAPVSGAKTAVSQLVKVDPDFEALVTWVLNDSWLVDDLKPLVLQGRVPMARLISREGERWDRRSWRLRGSEKTQDPDASSWRIGRKQRWELAKTHLKSIEEEASEIEAENVEAQQVWQECLSQHQSWKGELAHLNPSLKKHKEQAAALNTEYDRLCEAIEVGQRDIENLKGQIQQHREQAQQLETELASAESFQQECEQELEEASTERESLDRERQQALISKTQVEASARSLDERLESLQSQLEEIETERDGLQDQCAQKERQRAEALNRIEELRGELQTHRDEISRIETGRPELEQDLTEKQEKLKTVEEERGRIVPKLLEIEQQGHNLNRQLTETTKQASERSYRRSHVIERLIELYRFEESMIDAELKSYQDPLSDEYRAQASEEVKELRRRLEGVGPVSLGSVEEYDELSQRYEFLQSQHKDLTQARDDLKQSIAQINRTAKSQFEETFDKIKEEFKHYYAKLFDGGQADLVLVEPDNVLESGIDIVARPPGKRLQSISLLSGGERALTAIALLFALFKVRPSPFCILDEIDAPLDEANVDRFTRVLEEFLALSQFILITHNKKTITKADCLYGVTMQEAGVSAILSAKLGKETQVVQKAAAGG